MEKNLHFEEDSSFLKKNTSAVHHNQIVMINIYWSKSTFLILFTSHWKFGTFYQDRNHALQVNVQVCVNVLTFLNPYAFSYLGQKNS